jgi:ribose 5-phosphate isomerase A
MECDFVDPKEAAAMEAVKYVEDGMVVGLGSGSTANIAIKMIGEKIRADDIEVIGIPTSAASDLLGRAVGIKIGDLDDHRLVDMTIDGADEVDAELNLVKGLGGALVREKMVAASTRVEMIVVDESKLVEHLGQNAPVPVEIINFSYNSTVRRLATLGCEPVIRVADGRPFVTDNGNLIADCRFDTIDDPESMESRLNLVPGVVDNGLFIGLADKVIVGSENGVRIIERPAEPP